MTEIAQQDSARASLEEIWYLKEIRFTPPGSDTSIRLKIITQNYNGWEAPSAVPASRILTYMQSQTMFIYCYLYIVLVLHLHAFTTNLLCIGNILILRGDIEILPADRGNVSYEQLAQLLAEHLLKTQTDVDIDSALATMPVTRSTHPPHCVNTIFHSFFPMIQRVWT